MHATKKIDLILDVINGNEFIVAIVRARTEIEFKIQQIVLVTNMR